MLVPTASVFMLSMEGGCYFLPLPFVVMLQLFCSGTISSKFNERLCVQRKLKHGTRRVAPSFYPPISLCSVSQEAFEAELRLFEDGLANEANIVINEASNVSCKCSSTPTHVMVLLSASCFLVENISEARSGMPTLLLFVRFMCQELLC